MPNRPWRADRLSETQNENPERWLTLTELLEALNISRATFYRHGLRRLALEIGGCNRYRLADVLRALGYMEPPR